MSFSVINEDGTRSHAIPDTTVKPWRSCVGSKGDDPAFWEKERQRLIDTAGDLDGFAVPMNRILVAVWERPEVSGGGIILTAREDRYQGVAGIVLAYGPMAYVSDAEVTFAPEDKPALHSWVVFRRGDGFRVPIRGASCVVLEGEKGIKAVIPRPDLVTEG